MDLTIIGIKNIVGASTTHWNEIEKQNKVSGHLFLIVIFFNAGYLKINEFISVVGAPAKKLKKKVGIQRMASANILFIVSVS